MISLHFHIERWKKNKEYGVYVSTDGRIKDDGKKIVPQRVSSATGYAVIKLGNYWVSVHKLVAETWLKGGEGKTIDHKDSNKRNNKLSNLEYVTLQENFDRASNNLVVENDSKVFDTIAAPNEVEWFYRYKLKFPKKSRVLEAEIAIPRIKQHASQHKKYLGYLLKRKPDGTIVGEGYFNETEIKGYGC